MSRGTSLGEGPHFVGGADGCRAGWVVAIVASRPSGRLALQEVSVAPDFAGLLELTQDCAAVAVDIPIGLSESGLRDADFAARRFIGPRRSSVFPVPARALLDQPGDYHALNALSRRLTGHGISQQSYNILPKIREADALLTPRLQCRVVEAHPEVVFCALKGAHLPHAKRHPLGRGERQRLLESVYGPEIGGLRPSAGAGLDDLYDALVLCWTAARVARGEAVHLPAEPRRDQRGLEMEIVY